MTTPEAAGQQGAGARLRHWRDRYREAALSLILGLQVATMFVVSPLAATGVINAGVAEAFRFGLAATAILVVSRNRFVAAFVAISFIVSMLCAVFLRTMAAGQVVLFANIVITLAFDLAVAGVIARAAFGAGRITVHRIMGAIILYLYIGLIFAGVYRLCELTLHPSFHGLSATQGPNFSALLYFSMSTLTTAGYGDIVPVHPFVRSLANLESVMGQLYPATLLARIVTLHGVAAARGIRPG